MTRAQRKYAPTSCFLGDGAGRWGKENLHSARHCEGNLQQGDGQGAKGEVVEVLSGAELMEGSNPQPGGFVMEKVREGGEKWRTE